jgi:hypothetical protein
MVEAEGWRNPFQLEIMSTMASSRHLCAALQIGQSAFGRAGLFAEG